MRTHGYLLSVATGVAIATTSSAPLWAQAPAALSGKVSAAGEAALEGVLVSAKKDRRHHHHHGRQRREGSLQLPCLETRARPIRSLDPRDRLRSRRAASGRDRAAQPATADIKLVKTRNLSRQLTNGEWITSMPGTQQQKLSMLNCVSCHTVERIVKSSYDKDGFATQILPRMGGYANQSMPTHPQRRVATRLLEERGEALAAGAPEAGGVPELDQSERERRRGTIRSRHCRARRAAAPRSSSPNTICRARPSSRMT